VKLNGLRVVVLLTLAPFTAFPQDLASAVAAKYKEVQAAIAEGDFAGALALSKEVTTLIRPAVAAALLSPQQLLQKGEAVLSAHPTADPNVKVYYLYLMPNTALDAGALDKAGLYASSLLDTLGGVTKVGSGIYGDALFEAKTVLGQIALQNGDLVSARQDLLDSVSGYPYSSRLSQPGGIRYDLASALLAKGAGDVVVQFLTQCGVFRQQDQKKYAVWIAAIKGGAMPELSNR